MRGINEVFLSGNATADPEFKTIKDKALLTFTLAVNSSSKEYTSYIPIKLWGKGAEIFSDLIKKGTPMVVHGALKTGKYEAKDGTTKYTFYVFAIDIRGIPSSGNGKPSQVAPEEHGFEDDFSEPGEPSQAEQSEDDIPF